MSLRKATLWFSVPALLLAAGLAGWSWLLHSESGARWLVSKLESSGPGAVGYSALSGDLGSGLRISGLSFDDGNTRVEVGQLAINVNVDLLPPVIGLESLKADQVVIRTLQAAGQKTSNEIAIPNFSLPVPLRFDEVRITGIEAFNYSGDSTLTIHSVFAAGSLYNELTLDQLVVTLPDQEIAVSGRLGFAAPQPVALEFTASGGLELNGSLNGSLESAALLLDSENPRLHITGTLEQLLRRPSWQLDFSSPGIQWPLTVPEPTARLGELKAHSNGDLSQFNLELAGKLQLQGLEAMQLELAGSGTGGDFTADRLSLRGDQLSAGATGTVSWQDALSLAFNASIEYLNPALWLETWPEGHAVNGDLEVEWTGETLKISGFSLAVSETSLTTSGHGVIDLQSGVVDAELNWTNFSWPPGDPAPMVSSSNGGFLVSGRPDNWKLDGQLALQAATFPESQLHVSGAGDQESLGITVHEGKVLGGALSGDINWNWTGARPFNTNLNLDNIDLTPLLPEYPARLSASLTAGGELEPFQVGVDLQQLDGTIDGLPINANGGFHVERGRVFADTLNIRSGASTLLLNGSLYEPGGIEFSANIENLARFSDDFSGNVTTAGTVSLYPESPIFSVTLSARQLVFGPIEIAEIETFERTGASGEAGREVLFTGLVIGQRPVESLSFRMAGEQPLQRVSINALVEGTEIVLELDGSVNDWSDPLASGWSGLLTDLRFAHQGQTILALDNAIALDWNPAQFNTELACFSGAQDARMCLESSWRSGREFSASADLAAVPLGLLELFTDTDVRFTQILSGAFDWSQNANGERLGGARIEISPGTIELVDEEEVLLETGPGLFGFELSRGQLQNGKLDISFADAGDIDLDFSVRDISLGPDSPIEGIARIDLSDIGVIGVLMPLFDTINGALDVDLNLSGTLSDPAFQGKAELVNGLIENRASGFSFSEINISGVVTEFDRSELKGSFRAGEGLGEISTTIYFEDVFSPVINLSLKGETLTLVDVPDLNLVANPDITLDWHDSVLEINGRLVIPSARLSPSYLPQSSISQSEDVVIVAGELPAPEKDFLQERAISFRGNLEVELGNEVVIELDLANVDVKGVTQFSWQDDMIPIANGSLDLSGDIQAYGQSLQITRGRISFPDIPADNPHLNIRAEREIFGNAQIRRAGLMVTGTVRRPLIEAYTEPMTNRERAQTLLVTGSDFNYEQGVGAVDVGMYVLPRLYISYGIGVFEDGNVIKARYDIGKGFGIRATSGQRETGLDISYTVER